MILKCQNLLTESAPETKLSFAEIGTTALRGQSSSGFSPSWAIQIGKTGEEKSEVRVLGTAALGGTAGTITAATSYDHPADTPIYGIKYDQVVFERSTVGTSGTATPMTDGTVTIQADSDVTIFDDTSGSASYGYRTYFRNSVLNVTTTESDWITSAGYGFYTQAKIRERARARMLNSNSIDDDKINDWINEWLEKMNNTAIDVNEDYSLGTCNVGFSGTAQEGTITNDDFKQVRRAWHTTGDTWYRMTKNEFANVEPNEEYNETDPHFYMKGDNVIGRIPHNTDGTIGLTYYKLNATLASDTDTLPVAMRGYTSSFVKFCEAQAKKDDNKATDAEKLELQAEFDRKQFEKEISNRNKSGPTFISIVEDLGDSEEGIS